MLALSENIFLRLLADLKTEMIEKEQKIKLKHIQRTVCVRLQNQRFLHENTFFHILFSDNESIHNLELIDRKRKNKKKQI